MKNYEIMKKTKEELSKLLRVFQKDLFKLKSASLSGEDAMKKKGQTSNVKKAIARIKTRLNN